MILYKYFFYLLTCIIIIIMLLNYISINYHNKYKRKNIYINIFPKIKRLKQNI